MSTFGDSRAVQVFVKKRCLQKIDFFSMKEQRGFDKAWGFKLGRSLGYMVVPFLWGCNTLGASGGAFSAKVLFF